MDIHAAARDGVVSTASLKVLGMGPADLRRLRHDGTLLRLARGWYALRPAAGPAPWEADLPWDAELALHRLRTIALVRSFDGRAVASHHSALAVHGIAMWQPDLTTVHLMRTEDKHSRHRTGAVIHPRTGPGVLETGTCSTVPLATAVVQTGLRPTESAPARPMESLVAADDVLHRRLVTAEDLLDQVRRHAAHPGIHAVRELLVHADGRHESPGETRLAHALRLLGHETEPQAVVTVRGRRFRADLLIKGTRVYLEFDGIGKYFASGKVDELSARRSLAAEKVRHDAIVEDEAEVVRVTWPELDDLASLGRRVDAAIARWRRRSA